MAWHLGLDSSTQGVSGVIIDLEDGSIVDERAVSFGEFPEFGCPQGFLEHPDPLVKQADPLVWLAGLDRLLGDFVSAGIDLGQVRGISGSGQQHGTVYLKQEFLGAWPGGETLTDIVRPMLSRTTAPIWMDSSTSAECAEITESAGGAAYVQRVTGSPAIERFSGPQIRKFAKEDPGGYAQTAVVHLVSSFLASVLAGRSVGIDLGDGAGMNLLNLERADWDAAMVAATAPDLGRRLPPAVPSSSSVGTVASYFVGRYGFRADAVVTAWSGDNPNSLIGVGGHAPGTAVISLGTSHTYFAAMTRPTVDPDGYGHVFGNPAGGFMSLICFKNGALAEEEVRAAHGLNWEQFDACLDATPPGNDGNLLLPYYVSEITPLVLDAGPARLGTDIFVNDEDPAALVRAVVESQALRLRMHSSWIEDTPTTVRVTGGASVNDRICQVIADVFNARLERLETGNSAGLGAAMRAAESVAGAGWADLTAAFSKPVPGRDVKPVPDNVAVYAEMLPRFAEFARHHCE